MLFILELPKTARAVPYFSRLCGGLHRVHSPCGETAVEQDLIQSFYDYTRHIRLDLVLIDLSRVLSSHESLKQQSILKLNTNTQGSTTSPVLYDFLHLSFSSVTFPSCHGLSNKIYQGL